MDNESERLNKSAPETEEEEEFKSTLRSAPSFEIYNTSHGEFGEDETYPGVVLLKRRESHGSAEFTFGGGGRKRMELIEEDAENERIGEKEKEDDDDDDVVDLEPPSPPMYLAAGLGVDATGFDANAVVGFENSLTHDDVLVPNLQESEDLEGYYKRMVDEYPYHPLILKKHAQILKSKGNLEEAAEYFYRATLAEPNDGEALMEYAKLLWEHHHDKDRAVVYFERAVQAAPKDSHVLAAYTSFLWETDDDDNDVGNDQTQSDKEKLKTEPVKPSNEGSYQVRPFVHISTGQEIDIADINTVDWSGDSDVADYLRTLVEENPNNLLVLKKYAQFLFQSKDPEAAEDFYSRAVLADPSDGEMISEYARLVWELHHDQEKASSLFEQAVQATPGNSNVLAAYTCFLWELEDGES
ncbi:uncharacterized protein LOC130951102 [Arachis stenosperma]|uniref:uncharacterized protein LOC130951102 n=1 Tax=Arachis stenosperma TaxID=217475 RepID=UPI0025ABE3FB|nr:uncharacterized protein LOC130951102 [Arachis stenosperma]XP_057735699.1 uncharacterized protein LOC130951102 [Arachis stenosperma]